MPTENLASQRWEDDYRRELVKKNYIICFVAAALVPVTLMDLEKVDLENQQLFILSRVIPAIGSLLAVLAHRIFRFNATALFYIVYFLVFAGSVIRTDEVTYTNYVFYHVTIFVVTSLIANIKVHHTIIVCAILSVYHISFFFLYYHPEVPISSGGLLIFVALCVMFIIANKIRFDITKKNFIISRELEEQNLKIIEQKESLENLYEELSEKNEAITDSITYAQRIQNAKLPDVAEIKQAFPEHFVLFKPRDIVSGDFYWFKTIGHENFIVAADCTGHGVPGAFMSVIGSTLLSQIIEVERVFEPGLILSRLNVTLIESLSSSENEKVNDGMDIAICSFNSKTKILKYAGAKNPMLLISNGEMEVVKGDRRPIGAGYDDTMSDKPFPTHEYLIDDPTMIYIFSDGFQDQFGGKKARKYGRSKFYKKLEEISLKNPVDQVAILEGEYDNWVKDDNDQLDDILVIGFSVG